MGIASVAAIRSGKFKTTVLMIVVQTKSLINALLMNDKLTVYKTLVSLPTVATIQDSHSQPMIIPYCYLIQEDRSHGHTKQL